MNSKISSLFLVHCETGQRYPIRGDVVIGRHTGDIVFSKDSKLSQEHCRIRIQPDGALAICDLNSGNGTFIDGKKITPDRLYRLSPENELKVGDQAFLVKSVSVERVARTGTGQPKRKRSRSRRKQKADLVNTFAFFVIFAVILAGTAWVYYHPSILAGTVSPLADAQRELKSIQDGYDNLISSLEHGAATPKETIIRIQARVVIRLNALSGKLSTVPVSNEHDRNLLTLEQDYITTLSKQANARISFINNADLKSESEIDSLEDQADNIIAMFNQSLEENEKNLTLPIRIQTPMQMVEKEMRQALSTYKRLGDEVRGQKVSEKEMAQVIRDQLIPKLTSTSEKMGVLKPDGEVEFKRLALEQKLVLAFLGQVKAMASLTDTQDEKYSRELEHWSAQIEKINSELKSQTQRQPANQ